MSDLLIGRWAVCARGELGKIERYDDRGTYYGRTLWGTPWQSKQPKLVTENSGKYLDMQLEFGEEAMRQVLEHGRARKQREQAGNDLATVIDVRHDAEAGVQ